LDAPSTHYEQPIVVIEADADLGHIVALALRHHGHPVFIYRSLAEAWEATTDTPALAILDAGPASPQEWSPLAALQRHRLLGTAPVVLLAWECELTGARVTGPNVRICLAKPFDARALDEAVTALLVRDGSIVAPAPNGVPVASQASMHEPAEAPSPPSLWPLATAAGGFIAVVGFMIHPVLVIAGLIVMIGSILRWALEPADSSARA
jgi:DNA-binding response OmpR family regulator